MGLLTFLRNFLFPKKSRKSITKVSKRRTRKPSSPIRGTKRKRSSKPFKIEEEYDIIEFSVNDTVEIEHDIDNILDFINTFAPELKKEIIDVLEKPNDNSKDTALFMVSTAKNQDEGVYYIVLCKVVTLGKDNGLMLVYSQNLDLISLYLSNLTTMSYAKVKESFNKKDGHDLEDKG
jgi:hypothetical protein